MKVIHLATLCLTASLLTISCRTTSISSPGSANGYGSRNSFHKGELHTYDILGIPKGNEISEDQINKALSQSASSAALRIPAQGKILLVQSGALQPDPSLKEAIAPHFQAIPLSGIPLDVPKETAKTDSTSKRLRLAAAQAGAKHVVVVWGSLESSTGDLATKTVSWVPIAGQLFTDERRATRIHLKAIILDTASGSWRAVNSPPVIRDYYSSRISREAKWDRHVESLKSEAYPHLATALTQM